MSKRAVQINKAVSHMVQLLGYVDAQQATAGSKKISFHADLHKVRAEALYHSVSV